MFFSDIDASVGYDVLEFFIKLVGYKALRVLSSDLVDELFVFFEFSESLFVCKRVFYELVFWCESRDLDCDALGVASLLYECHLYFFR